MTTEQKRRAAARKDAAALRNIPRMAYWHMAHRPYRVKRRDRGAKVMQQEEGRQQ